MTRRHFQRAYLETLTSHLHIGRPPIQVILGPRQVGKTTAILRYLEKWKGPSVYRTADQISPPDARDETGPVSSNVLLKLSAPGRDIFPQ